VRASPKGAATGNRYHASGAPERLNAPSGDIRNLVGRPLHVPSQYGFGMKRADWSRNVPCVTDSAKRGDFSSVTRMAIDKS
jgi:hypothetical protein